MRRNIGCSNIGMSCAITVPVIRTSVCFKKSEETAKPLNMIVQYDCVFFLENN